MSKIGCCINMLADDSDRIGATWLPVCQSSGCDYVELPLAQVMELDDTEFEQLLHRLDDNRLPCEVLNNFFPGFLKLTGEEASLEKIERYLIRAMERVKRLGASVIVFGSSAAKNVPDGYPKELAYRQIVKTLKLIGAYAGREGIRIAIEPLHRGESNIICTMKEGHDLMREAASSSVGMVVDYYHFHTMEESIEELIKAGNDVIHVHFADCPKRSFPQTEKAVHQTFFQALKKMGYRGRVSLEAFSVRPEAEIKTSIQLLRQLCSFNQQ